MLDVQKDPTEILIYTAFATPGWLESLRGALDHAAQVTVRLGLDIPATPQRVLVDLMEMAAKPGRDIRLVKHLGAGTFHTKVYGSRFADWTITLVGSSNGSEQAFSGNVEANLVLTGPPGSDEDSAAKALFREIDVLLDAASASGRVRIWRLPADPLPTLKPAWANVARLEPEVAERNESDAWEDSPSFKASKEVARWDAPLSGLYDYADNTGRQAGLYIPRSHRETVLKLLGQYGNDIQLSWRFVTLEGATIFPYEQDRRALQASGQRPASHNLAITATRPTISLPATRLLRGLGMAAQDRFDIEYRLDLSGTRPRLWLIHRLQRSSTAISGTDVLV